MRISDYNGHIFADLEKTNTSSWKNNGSLFHLTLIDQVIPTDSIIFLGGRPRTGKTSLLLDFVARSSLLPSPLNKVLHNDIMPRRGLVIFIGQKQDITLQRWFSIVAQENFHDLDGQSLHYLKDSYKELIDGADIHFYFYPNTENLDTIIAKEVERIDPDFVVVDHINGDYDSQEYGLYVYGNDNDLLNGLIQLQQQAKKLFLISSSLGHDAWYRSGSKKHCLEDMHSFLIEKNADMVLMLHRPELFGLDVDENGDSLKGIVEVDIVLNRLGRELLSRQWRSIGDIPKLDK